MHDHVMPTLSTTATAGRRVLLVDDDANILRNFRFALEDAGFSVSTAGSSAQAHARLNQEVFDIAILDLMIGEESGLELLSQVRAVAPWTRVLMATSQADLSTAVSAMQKGAQDYLLKPCSPEQLIHATERQCRARQLELRVEQLEGQRDSERPELASAHPGMTQILEMARQVASTEASVLILGESGTGKGVLAAAIHEFSERRAAVMGTVNCPSLSAELLESELFGHVRGAFTGAVEHRQGRVQIAEGGTLFLDEIGDFPLALQPKLLRFVQDRVYERVGDPHTRKSNVRIIAATNRNLEMMVKEGRFREDLYYRLNVINFELPPLRERHDDIPRLAERFLLSFAASYRRPARQFDAAAMSALCSYHWPGNIRELRNIIERVSILCPQAVVERHHLPLPGISVEVPGVPRVGAPVSLDVLERAHIEAILSSASSLELAAKTLGVDASTLYRKRKQLGL